MLRILPDYPKCRSKSCYVMRVILALVQVTQTLCQEAAKQLATRGGRSKGDGHLENGLRVER